MITTPLHTAARSSEHACQIRNMALRPEAAAAAVKRCAGRTKSGPLRVSDSGRFIDKLAAIIAELLNIQVALLSQRGRAILRVCQ